MKTLADVMEVAIDTPISPLTFDELHAAILGTSMGYWLGRRKLSRIAVIASSVVILGVLPDSKGTEALVTEPWYFIGSMLVSYQVGRYI